MAMAFMNRRNLITASAALVLAGCAVIPKTAPPPAPTPTPEPSATALPDDAKRHRVALLVPLAGENGEVGQSIANATTMAILDTNADNLRITTYDTSRGAGAAARAALADGNSLILGPLLGSNVAALRTVAGTSNVPVITFSNDTSVAGPGVFVMGHVPEQSISRSVEFARGEGARNFAVLSPDSDYGRRAEAAMQSSLANYGGRLVATERYARSNTSIISAGGRLKAMGGFDTVLIADGGTTSIRGAEAVSAPSLRILGTERWAGESGVLRSNALRGALFSAVTDKRYPDFVKSYEARFGGQPYRIATLGYDGVLLTLRAARDWKVGQPFPVNVLFQDGGFDGMDGPFRFRRNGVVDRAMEVRRIEGGTFVTVSAAPTGF